MSLCPTSASKCGCLRVGGEDADITVTAPRACAAGQIESCRLMGYDMSCSGEASSSKPDKRAVMRAWTPRPCRWVGRDHDQPSMRPWRTPTSVAQAGFHLTLVGNYTLNGFKVVMAIVVRHAMRALGHRHSCPARPCHVPTVPVDARHISKLCQCEVLQWQ